MEEKGKMLIVDDEIEVINTLRRIFGKYYELYFAGSAKEAMEVMKALSNNNEEIDVILCDQRMPEMKGTDFYKKIKDIYPDTIRLLITGYSALNDVISAINEGNVFRYLTKPWNADELKNCVKEAFEKRNLIKLNKKLITELKNINNLLEEKVQERTNELNLKNEELEKANKEKNKILGIVAHDLRNPLSSLYGLSEFIYENIDTIEKQELLEIMKLIRDTTKYSLELTDNLIDINVIESGKLNIKLEEIDYKLILNEVLFIQKEFAKKKNILIEVICNFSGSINIFVDPLKINQVLNNLLSNAIKYSDKNSKIIIKVEDEGEYLKTSILDNGVGILDSEKEKLFKLFSTTSSRPTNKEKSIGLGLYISKKIVDIHGGEIGYEKNHPKGSIFYFKLRK